MSDKFELLLEAERRGILPPEKLAVLQEARNRGLLDAPQKKESGGLIKPIQDFSLAVTEGASFGFADELFARLKTAINDRPLEQNLQDVRSRFNQVDPAVRVAGNVGGGLVTGGAGAARAAALPIIRALPNVAKFGTIGIGEGAVSGAGFAEEGNRTRGAIEGAVIGGALGSAVPAVTGAMARRVGVSKADRNAAQKVAEALQRDELTPSQALAKMRALGPSATLADVSENLQGLARGVASVPGKSRNMARRVLDARQKSQGPAVSDRLRHTVGPDNFFERERQLLDTLSENAEPAYKAAYRAHPSLMSPKLSNILNRPIMKRAVREASDLASIEGRLLGPLDTELKDMANLATLAGKMRPVKGGIAKGFRLETWDDVKRGLDVLIEREITELPSGAIKMTKRGRAIKRLKNNMVQELDKITGGDKSLYKAARDQYAGDAEMLDALREGQKALRLAPEEITAKISRLGSSEQAAYRSGAARALTDIVEKTGDTTDVTRRMFGNNLIRRKIRSLSKSEAEFRALEKTMLQQSRFSETRRTVLGGSPTARIQAEQSDLAGTVGTVLGSQVSGGMNELLKARLGRQVLQRLFPAKPVNNEALGNMLFTPGVQGANTFELPLNRILLAQRLAQQSGALGAGLAPGAAGLGVR